VSLAPAPLFFARDGKGLFSDADAPSGALTLTEVATRKESRRFRLPSTQRTLVATAQLSGDGQEVLILGDTHVLLDSTFVPDRPQLVYGWDISTTARLGTSWLRFSSTRAR
jgi:hypothetical protein